ncbi:MAG TPA: potassium channel family protein [Desulfomonilaceae bacterium]|nr:potassium channel family protein [Desulfomonilaceae bacterium]
MVPTVLHEKALLTLGLCLGLLLLGPFVPGTLTSMSFATIGVGTAFILSKERTLSRRVILLFSSAVVFVVVFAKLIPSGAPSYIRVAVGITALGLTMALYGVSAVLILSALLKAKQVTHDLIISAVNLYIILGVFWAHVYSILNWFHPEAFGLNVEESSSVSHFIYFSFVTLATLGYGDITPKTEFAQRLAILEAIMGQFYGSVVVAYLLSVYIGRIIRRDQG